MKTIILGIDISKRTFDVALLIDSNKVMKPKKFNNDTTGFLAFKQWLLDKGVNTAHACMEATNSYGLALAQYLYDNNFKVSIVNPARIKGFSLSQLSRVKTDKSDSILIAQFCLAMNPDLWQPINSHILQLQQLVNRLDSLIAIKNQETNRLEAANSTIATTICSHVEFLNKQIKEIEQLINDHIKSHKDLNDKSTLLESIPGVGEKTIAVVLAFLSNIEDFDSAKRIVAFIGINPKPRQSGSSINGASRISKTGDTTLRKAFYMPALTSLRYNPIIKAFAERLTKAGKPKMVIVVAAMRKLLHIIYGVLKTKTLFSSKI